MARELRGSRYLTKANEPFARFLVEELHYLDYEETLRWYRVVGPSLSHNDMALLGCNDRFFMLSTLLRRPDVVHPWLFMRCREVEASPDGHMDLWARYHYKSTIGTFAGIVQEVMIDPEIRVCILSVTKPIAEGFLTQIKDEFEQNELLQRVYKDVLYANPRVEAPRWAVSRGIVVKRKGNAKEATVEAWGLVDGQPTSRHYDLLDYDDIVTDKSVTNEELVKKTTLAWERSDNLGTQGRTRKWHWGTRYSFGDSYGIIVDRGVARPRIYPATEDGLLTGKPVFMDKKRWDEVKSTQRSTVFAQMLLNPVAGNEAMFRIKYLRTYDIRPTILNVYIMCDPSKGRSKKSDRTAIAVIGIDIAGNRYLLDGIRHRMRLSERWDTLKALHKRWTKEPGVQMVRVGYERFGQQADDEVLREYMVRDKYEFDIEELSYPREGDHSKRARVERLEPDIRNGKFYFPAIIWNPNIGVANHENLAYWSTTDDGKIEYRQYVGPTNAQKAALATGQRYRVVKAIKQIDEDRNVYDLTRAFIEELKFFPFAPHDDLVDAVSRIYDMQPLAPTPFEQEAAEPIIHPDS